METATGQSDIRISFGPEGWIRRRQWTTPGAAVFAAANAIFYAGVFSWAFSETKSDELLFAVVAGGLMSLGLVGGSALVAIRMLRAGLYLTPRGITVRGPLRTWRVELRDARRFVPARQPGLHGGELVRCTFGAVLERREGRDVPIWALRSAEWSSREGLERAAARWQPACDVLNRVLADAKGEAVPASTRTSGADRWESALST